jgi:hypothetical protein
LSRRQDLIAHGNAAEKDDLRDKKRDYRAEKLNGDFALVFLACVAVFMIAATVKTARHTSEISIMNNPAFWIFLSSKK